MGLTEEKVVWFYTIIYLMKNQQSLCPKFAAQGTSFAGVS